MNDKELIEALRYIQTFPSHLEICREAADRLEELTQKNEPTLLEKDIYGVGGILERIDSLERQYSNWNGRLNYFEHRIESDTARIDKFDGSLAQLERRPFIIPSSEGGEK